MQNNVSQRVRAWYGLPGEIIIENDYWHLVKVGGLPLPHPPVINLLIRRGLPRSARRQLSYWHEFGHLQTLPLALGHAIWLWRHKSPQRQKPLRAQLLWLATALVIHEAGWELAAESYVVGKIGGKYKEWYRQYPNPLLAAFWVGMTGVALLGTVIASK